MKKIIGFDGRVLNNKNLSGVERYALELNRRFMKLNNSITLKPKQKLNFVADHLWYYTLLPILLRNYSVNTLFCPANIAPFNLNRKIKLATTIHDVNFLKFPKMYSKLFLEYYKFVIPRIISRSDAIITISKSSMDDIISFFPNSRTKINVSYIGVTDDVSNIDQKKKRQILCVSSFYKGKNIPGLIKSFQKIKHLIPHNLILVGSFNNNVSADLDIKKCIDQEDRIIIKSNISNTELNFLYNTSEIFVLPSFYEGFGMTPIEAMKCGAAVIASNHKTIMEVCSDAAFYFDPYNIDDMSKCMLKICFDEKKRRELILNGKKRALFFNLDNSFKNVMNVVNSI